MSPETGSTAFRLKVSVLAATAVAVAAPLSAQDAAPAVLDLNSIKVDVVEDVIIPIPQEIFASLDKLGAQNWGGHLQKKDVRLDGNRSRTALLFGLVISEGFIAVQAENRDEVKRIGREVLNLSGALAVKGAVEGHAQAIIDGADADNWAAVRRELDRTRETVISTMEEQRDKELSELVSIGGWLGGTRTLASLVSDNYSPDASELLHQPDLLIQIAERYRRLPAKSKPGPLFIKVSDTLDKLQPLMKTGGDGAVKPAAVKQIDQLSTDLTDAIYAP